MKISGLEREFYVIGENIHATRVYLLKGKHIVQTDDGREAIQFTDKNNDEKHLYLTEEEKKSQNYAEGRVKHMKVAMQQAMQDSGQQGEVARAYLEWQMQRQVDAGADFLDLNVDEISTRESEQQAAMVWLVEFMQACSPIPLAIDSSNPETIRIGLETYNGVSGRPLLNSASLERISALELAKTHNALVVATAAGSSAMPSGPEERLDHVTRMVEQATAIGIPVEDIHVDPLFFPISVDVQFGQHAFDAIRMVRERFGPEIHITGGFSNVSFGLPCRRLINDVFFILATEYGADSAIIDPVTSNPQQVFDLDRSTNAYQLALAMLMGEDKDCKKYLKAYRKGELNF